MIAIVDYGVGNLFSLKSSLAYIGQQATVTGDIAEIQRADRVILPGVGAFGDAIQRLQKSGLVQPLQQVAAAGTPLLGICLGMQLLFEESHEFGVHKGLGLVPGSILPLQQDLSRAGYNYKVPHIGWNALQILQPQCPLFKYAGPNDSVYFVHSFYARAGSAAIATAEYGVQVTAAVQNKNVYGTQFHPEKSGDAGLAMLRAFAEV